MDLAFGTWCFTEVVKGVCHSEYQETSHECHEDSLDEARECWWHANDTKRTKVTD
jgi:hypothetical protein